VTKTDRDAACNAQRRALGLRPWELAPCQVDDERPAHDRNKLGLFKAWELRRRLIAAALSPYEPDPIGALAKREAVPPAA
jgi:hypothetical protein